MREIKFQAWDIDFKKMWIVMSLTREEQTPFMLVRESIESESCARPSKLLKIRQYTGLKDNNGKEIYEGDIVECQRFLPNYQKDRTIGYVTFETPAFFIITEEKHGKNWIDFDNDAEPYEILGNIYENPELLEKK